ncbi:MAG: hypothetical protein R3Y11_02400 [Pseudomonadota bacterium]
MNPVILSPETPIAETLQRYPYLHPLLLDYAPAFARLTKPLNLDADGNAITLQQVADLAGLELAGLLTTFARGLMEHEGLSVTLIPRKTFIG